LLHSGLLHSGLLRSGLLRSGLLRSGKRSASTSCPLMYVYVLTVHHIALIISISIGGIFNQSFRSLLDIIP
jgi:hypothetical protein